MEKKTKKTKGGVVKKVQLEQQATVHPVIGERGKENN